MKKRKIDGDSAGGRAKLTLLNKYDILTMQPEDGTIKPNYTHVGQKFGVSRQSIAKIFKRKDAILKDYNTCYGDKRELRKSLIENDEKSENSSSLLPAAGHISIDSNLTKDSLNTIQIQESEKEIESIERNDNYSSIISPHIAKEYISHLINYVNFHKLDGCEINLRKVLDKLNFESIESSILPNTKIEGLKDTDNNVKKSTNNNKKKKKKNSNKINTSSCCSDTSSSIHSSVIK